MLNFQKTTFAVKLLIILFFCHLLTIASSHAEPRYVQAFYPLMIPFVALICLPLWNLIILKQIKDK